MYRGWKVNGWQNKEFELLIFALWVGVVCAGLVAATLRLGFLGGLLIFFVVFFLVFGMASAQKKALQKMYHASIDDAVQVVQNVLEAKGLPYQKRGSYRFVLDENGIEISLVPSRAFSSREPTTILKLIPLDPDSWHLIFNLREKLDDAFRPRGL